MAIGNFEKWEMYKFWLTIGFITGLKPKMGRNIFPDELYYKYNCVAFEQ